MRRVLSLINLQLVEFRTFILRGNVIDLAVGIVIGAAFQGVVNAFVTDLLTPIISIPAKTDFLRIIFRINQSTFQLGAFLCLSSQTIRRGASI